MELLLQSNHRSQKHRTLRRAVFPLDTLAAYAKQLLGLSELLWKMANRHKAYSEFHQLLGVSIFNAVT